MAHGRVDGGAVTEAREKRGLRAISATGLAAALDRPWVAAVAWLAVAATVFARASYEPLDFAVYYCSSLLLRQGRNPYQVDLAAFARTLGLETGAIRQATDPPTFLLCFEPFTMLPVHLAYWLWIALNVAALAGALYLLLHPRFSHLPRNTAVTLVALAVLYPPVGNNFANAQNKLLPLLLLAAMMRLIERRHERAAGLALSVAGLTRLFPMLLLGYLGMKRRWRAAIYAILGFAVGALITIAALGVPNCLGFISAVGFLTQQQWLENTSNVGIAAFVSRMFWQVWGSPLGPTAELARHTIIIVADLAVLGFTLSATVSSGSREDPDWRVFSLWAVASVMLSPTAWFYYLVLTLLPLAQVASAACRGTVSRRAILMAAAAFALIGLLSVIVAALYILSETLAQNVRELEFASLLMMFIASYWFASDSSRPRPMSGHAALHTAE